MCVNLAIRLRIEASGAMFHQFAEESIGLGRGVVNGDIIFMVSYLEQEASRRVGIMLPSLQARCRASGAPASL